MTDRNRSGRRTPVLDCHVVLTSGGTSAPIDEVRKITNISTGRFSSRIAEAALELGAEVSYIHAPSAFTPYGTEARIWLDAPDPSLEIERLRDLQNRWQKVRDRLRLIPLREATVPEYAARLEETLRSRPVDIVFLAMAVSDYAPDRLPGKLSSDPDVLEIRCLRQPKVIRSVRDWAPDVFLVGFKLLAGASDAELIGQAESACLVNRADLTVANDMRTVREGRHVVHLVRPGHEAETIGPGPDLAERLVGRVLDLWRAREKKRVALEG